MNRVREILTDYSSGKVDLQETNAKLEQEKTGLRLDPEKNSLTEKEKRMTTVGYYPEQANGFGLLDTGTGSLDKVRVTAGRLPWPVNQVLPDGSTNMRAVLLIAGRAYEVKGAALAE